MRLYNKSYSSIEAIGKMLGGTSNYRKVAIRFESSTIVLRRTGFVMTSVCI